MNWKSPFPLGLVAGTSVDDWAGIGPEETLLPMKPHPGAFGDVRARHIHEGIDIYAPPQTPVLAVEDGTIVGVTPLTGGETRNGYWHDMEAVLVMGKTGLVAYCEFKPLDTLEPATEVKAGTELGHLYAPDYAYKNPNKPREDSTQTHFLHLELHAPHARAPVKWLVDAPLPPTLFDPTPHLLKCARMAAERKLSK